MPTELFQQNIFPIVTLENIFNQAIASPSEEQEQQYQEIYSPTEPIPSGQSFYNPKIIRGIIEGASFITANNKARVEIFPEYDKNSGIVVYDDDNNKVFETIIAGANVGDVIIGNYSGGQGCKWDKSAGTFTVVGILNVTSINIPDLITSNSFHTDSSGNSWWGSTTLATAKAKILNTGAITATDITIGSGDTFHQLTFAGSELKVNKTILVFSEIFGDGSDGNVNINSGSFSSGPITNNVLTRDAYFTDLTLSGGNLDTGGYRLFIKGTLTINSSYKIHRNGNAGGNGGNGGHAQGTPTYSYGGAAGAALASGSLYGGLAGMIGGDGAIGKYNTSANGNAGSNGTAGNNITLSVLNNGSAGKNGSAGGNAGAFTGGAGGTGGAAGTKSGTVYNLPHHITSAYTMYDFIGGDRIKNNAGSGSAAGGGGGAINGGSATSGDGGGGGGAGGCAGIVMICARVVVNNGSIEAIGGKGGNGGNGGDANTGGGPNAAGGGGGGAGGSGGGGGILTLIYSEKSGSGTTSIVGGAGGTKGTGGIGVNGGQNGTDGVDGNAGPDGTLIEMRV